MAKIMEMTKEQKNQVTLYLFNKIPNITKQDKMLLDKFSLPAVYVIVKLNTTLFFQ